MAEKTETPLLGAYLVVGDDQLMRQRVAERLRARLGDEADMAFNTDTFSGETASGADIVAACLTMPFTSERRLVCVSAADKLKKADAEALVSYLAAPVDSAVLLLDADKLAASTRLRKAVAALGPKAVIECSLPKAYQLPDLVMRMAKGHGVALDKRAAEALVRQVGSDTVRIDAELGRLALERGSGARVSAADIRGSVARTASAKPWDLADAFGRRDVKGCLEAVSRLDDTSPYALIVICCNRIRELMCAKAVAARQDGTTLAGELKQPEWRVRNLGQWARNYTSAELERALSSARDAEQRMKTSSDADAAFSDWLLGALRR